MAKKELEKTRRADEEAKKRVAAPPEDDEEAGDDEFEDEEYDDEFEDEPAHSVHHEGVIARPAPETEDPTWWAPHAVLGVLLVLGIAGFFGFLNPVLRPAFEKWGLLTTASAAPSSSSSGAPKQAAATPPATGKPVAPTPMKRPTADPAQPQGETYGAKHIVVMYKGSQRAPATITRTKDQAKARAQEFLNKVKKGAKFDDLVGEYSDEPNAGPRHGDLGKFQPGAMDPKFTEATKKLKVGEMSDVVETPFGFHVIVRTL